MVRRGLLGGLVGLLLCGLAWYLGRSEDPAPGRTGMDPEPATPAMAEAPRPLPPRLVEVIDLASAYEPVPEPIYPGRVDPASFIERRASTGPIPRAVPTMDTYDTVRMIFSRSVVGMFLPANPPERLSVMPREVLPIGSLLHVPEEQWISKPGN